MSPLNFVKKSVWTEVCPYYQTFLLEAKSGFDYGSEATNCFGHYQTPFQLTLINSIFQSVLSVLLPNLFCYLTHRSTHITTIPSIPFFCISLFFLTTIILLLPHFLTFLSCLPHHSLSFYPKSLNRSKFLPNRKPLWLNSLNSPPCSAVGSWVG